ncbi:NAD(P)/FAD-dependent oxidoreductase [Paraburkholderia sp. J7]|uniref:NAD(P)/FAD-dependent oxidoreductase n=1 Tax=Paraburkholderia sp. J7 TaxID=2805438 RepID=UPI002AB70ED1|nr:FAD-dependent oxidoreductase [Paraburkholderia sp. J7]
MDEMSGQQGAITVIGAGAAGWGTIREFRKRDAVTEVTLISLDDADFYSKPAISNALAQKRAPADLVTTPGVDLAATLNVRLVARSRVTSIDTTGRSVQVQTHEAGVLTLPYSCLVLATGAQPTRVPVAGDEDQIVSVNNLDDYRRFHALLGSTAKRVLILGAGLIGCEFAEDLLAAGHEVRIVDPAPRPLASILPEAASRLVQNALAQRGVRWDLGATLAKVEQKAGGALCATLSTGEAHTADLVLSAVGLRADIALPQAAGIRCERGVLVDDHLRTSAPDVYALGDLAQYGAAGNRTLPYVMPIMHAARALGATLAGESTAVTFPVMPVLIKTPSVPTVVVSPRPGSEGAWQSLGESSASAWRFVDGAGKQRGFALLGESVGRRMEMVKSMSL